jgi:hypothetical protein
MKSKERTRLLRAYNHFYERLYTEEGFECFYCAAPADTLDHSPPLAWLEPYGIKAFKESEIPLALIPCCSECNGLLGDRKLFTAEDRLTFLLSKYKKLQSKLVNWTLEEISEMGDSFKNTLKVTHHRHDELDRKIEALEKRRLKHWSFPQTYK